MKTFYRYVRPIRFDERRLEFNTLPNGGVCFRFTENPEGSLTFSFARCLPEDHFNKTVARRIADTRMTVLMEDDRLWRIASVPYSENTEQLAQFVIARCRQPLEDVGLLVLRYMHTEWLGLKQQLERLVAQNARERQKGAAFITAAHALELATAYEEKMREAANG